MFKHKPPVDRYLSKRLLNVFKAVLVAHNRLQIFKSVSLMMKTHTSVVWAGPTNRRNLQHKCSVDNIKHWYREPFSVFNHLVFIGLD